MLERNFTGKTIQAPGHGKYFIEQLAGKGAIASTYRARTITEHNVLGATVAIKIFEQSKIAPNGTNAEIIEFMMGFSNEANSLTKLVHPNIVRLIAPGADINNEIVF